MSRIKPAPGTDHISVDGPMRFSNPADAIVLLEAISDAQAYLAAFVEANPGFAETISGNTAAIAGMQADIQTFGPYSGNATVPVVLTKPKTVLIVTTSSATAHITFTMDETLKADGWEIEVYAHMVGIGGFASSFNVALENHTGSVAYAVVGGQGLFGSYHYYAKVKWSAPQARWLQLGGWEQINGIVKPAPLGAGQAWTFNIGHVNGGFGVVVSNDAFFIQPPVTKVFDLDITNGTNAYAALLPDSGFTFPDHEQFNITIQDYTGSSYLFPSTGNYELNVDAAGVASGNVDISAASLAAADVFQALANQLQMDLLSSPIADSYWDGTGWNLHVINGVGSLTGFSIYSVGGSMMSGGSLIISGDGANPLTGWTLGMDGNAQAGSGQMVINGAPRAFRITDIQLIPSLTVTGSPGATIGAWNGTLYLNDFSWGDLLDFGITSGGYTTGNKVKSVVGGNPDITLTSSPLTQDYPSGDSIEAVFYSNDLTTQQFATIRIIADFKS